MRLKIHLYFPVLLTLFGIPLCLHSEPLLDMHSVSHSSPLEASFEQRMGDMILQKIYGGEERAPDPVVNEYLQSLAKRFSQVTPIPLFKLHFFAIPSPELNAFAFFGNHVAVHTGLVSGVANENELAAVLAHETAHITQRHLSRILQHHQRMTPLTMAELFAALAIGSMVSSEAGAHLTMAALAGHTQKMINFTRDHEKEADRIGIQLLSRAHFDPHALGHVFERMKKTLGYQQTPPEYFLTHPLFDSRIADAENRAATLPTTAQVTSLSFYFIQARLAIEKATLSKQTFKSAPNLFLKESHFPRAALDYTEGLILLAQKHFQAAILKLRSLHQDFPEEWIIGLSLAEAEEEARSLKEASLTYQQLLKNHPKNYAVLLQYASFLLNQKEGHKVIQLLWPHKKEHSSDPSFHQRLARAYQITHQPVALHRAQAEWHYTRGEFKEAYQQLEIALERAEANPQWIERIQERIKSLKSIERDQQNFP